MKRLAVNADSTLLATAASSFVYVYALDCNGARTLLAITDVKSTALCFARRSGALEDTLFIGDSADNRLVEVSSTAAFIREIPLPAKPTSIAYAPGRDLLAVTDCMENVTLLAYETGEPSPTAISVVSDCRDAVFTTDGKHLLVVKDYSVTTFSVATGEFVSRFDIPSFNPLRVLAGDNGDVIVMGGSRMVCIDATGVAKKTWRSTSTSSFFNFARVRDGILVMMSQGMYVLYYNNWEASLRGAWVTACVCGS
jgi:hypothetical protein